MAEFIVVGIFIFSRGDAEAQRKEKTLFVIVLSLCVSASLRETGLRVCTKSAIFRSCTECFPGFL
jgi:hypothetical protein